MIFSDLQIYSVVTSYPGEMEDDEKELEHTSLQEKLDMELKELDKRLEQKEVNLPLMGADHFIGWNVNLLEYHKLLVG